MASTSMTATILLGAKSTEGSIKWYAGHESIYAAAVLEEAQALCWQRLRIREMVQRADVTAVSGASTLDLATLAPRFVQPIALKLDGYGKIAYRREEDFPDDRNASGALETGPAPSCWTVRGSTLHFDIELNAAVAGDLWYYAGLPLLAVSTNETNILTDKFPALFRHALMSRAYAHRNRADMLAAELVLFDREVGEANRTNDDFRYGQEL